MQDMLFAIAMIIGGARLDLPPAEIQQRFARECVDGKWEADCPALRTELEVELYGELRTLSLSREPIEREVLLAAARAQFPPLAEIGLRRLEKIQTPAERDIIAAAVDHASPGVRILARRLLDDAGDAWAKALARWWVNPSRGGWDALVPDPVPTAAQLGLPTVEKLRYRPFASGPGLAVFTSALPPDGVLTLIARGRKSFTGEEVSAAPKQQEAVAASMDTVEKQMREAVAKGDFKKLEEISRAMARQVEGLTSGADALGFRREGAFAADPSARYVRLDDGKSRPIQATMGRDAALGATVLMIRY